ncbi:hypothetical protein Emag_006368 [Eimeria magna]
MHLLSLLLLSRRDRDGYLSLTDFLSLLYPRRRANKLWATKFKLNHAQQQQQQQLQHQQEQQQQEQQQQQQHQQQQYQQEQQQQQQHQKQQQQHKHKASCSHDELAASSLQLASPNSQLPRLSPRLHTRLPGAEETILQLKWERKRRQREGRRALVADKDCCCAAESLGSLLGVASQGHEASCCLPSAVSLPIGLRRLSPEALAAALEMILAISRETDSNSNDNVKEDQQHQQQHQQQQQQQKQQQQQHTEAKLQGLRLLFREVDVFLACQQIRVYGHPRAAAANAAVAAAVAVAAVIVVAAAAAAGVSASFETSESTAKPLRPLNACSKGAPEGAPKGPLRRGQRHTGASSLGTRLGPPKRRRRWLQPSQGPARGPLMKGPLTSTCVIRGAL